MIETMKNQIETSAKQKLKGFADTKLTSKTMNEMKSKIGEVLMEQFSLDKKPRFEDLSIDPLNGQVNVTCKIPMIFTINLLSDEATD